MEPETQTTRVDFIGAKQILGINTICVSDVIKIGKELFYELNGKLQKIYRIFNRVIADDWAQRPHIKSNFDWTEELDVTWAGHPNWFFRLSKFTMPYITSKYVPETIVLDQLLEIPSDLENYVLKPLFSFSGSGVIFHVKTSDIESIQDPENFILQKKIVYYPGLEAPDGLVKAEIRVMILWPDDYEEPVFTTNLTRLSKGELIGVKFNKDKKWVGGTLSYFVD